MYTLRFSKSAMKTLMKMPRGAARRIREELGVVVADPAAYRGDWKPLQGAPNGWRLRVGDWRAICELRGDEWVVLVVKIAPRGDVYK
jgi:mRNA interferase RelE/StbE